MSFFVYMLGCDDRDGVRTYVGWTTEPERRLAEHNAGTGARSTRGRVWAMIHLEEHPTKQDAMRREWSLKRDRRTRRVIVAAWQGAQGAADGARRSGNNAGAAAGAGAPS